MVRGIASLAVPLRLLLFLAGILLATVVLAVIGFRSIGKEKLLEEKKYESAKANLKAAIVESSKKETEEIARLVQQDSLANVLSLFVFRDGVLAKPSISEKEGDELYMLDYSGALELKIFLDLQEEGKLKEAREYALEKANSFMQNPSIARLDWDSYFLEKMLRDIGEEQVLGEIQKLMRNLKTYSLHKDFLLALGSYANYLNAEYSFIEYEGKIFLVTQSIIAELDRDFYSKKMASAIREAAREWSYIPYSISGKFPFGESNILTEDNIILEEDSGMPNRDGTKFLLLTLVFSLIIPVIGVVVVYRGFSRERQLRLMKDNFLSTISHELKTPLTSVKMYSELITRKPEKAVNFTNVILKETNRLENLIDAILNYTRMESGRKSFHWEKISLSDCVAKVCDSVEVIASGKGLELRREIGDCDIMGDYQSIYSLAQNLVDNAIKYTSNGYVSVKLQDNSLIVEDTGKGIPLSEQKNIFEGFYRIGDESTRETKGTGLGLAIVKRTADIHKASIILESAPGKGAKFTVVFPSIKS